MGGGPSFTSASYRSLSADKGYTTMSTSEIAEKHFKKSMDSLMDPKGVGIRESRDSAEHPNSLAIMVWLDVTGSMRQIPADFCKNGMPDLMGRIVDKVQDAQVFFGAIGDHISDGSSLQVSQFETNIQLLDKWLTSVYLEGGGGGSKQESYLLAWYFAAFHTSIDCFEKRAQKGFLFTIGDEKTHPGVPSGFLRNTVGGQQPDYTAKALLAAAQKSYHVYHIHANDGSYHDDQGIISDWRELLGDNLIVVNNHSDIAKTIGDIVANHDSWIGTPPDTGDSTEEPYVYEDYSEGPEDEDML